MSFEGNHYEACKRIGVLEQQLADMTSDYHRWHQAFLDAKYPEMLPMRVDLEKALTLAAAWLPALDSIQIPTEIRKILIAAKDRSQSDRAPDNG